MEEYNTTESPETLPWQGKKSNACQMPDLNLWVCASEFTETANIKDASWCKAAKCGKFMSVIVRYCKPSLSMQMYANVKFAPPTGRKSSRGTCASLMPSTRCCKGQWHFFSWSESRRSHNFLLFQSGRYTTPSRTPWNHDLTPSRSSSCVPLDVEPGHCRPS